MTQSYCLNCKEDLSDKPIQSFMGVIVCDTCFKVATRLLGRAENEMRMLIQLYKEIVRTAIIKGELNFTKLPNEAGRVIRKIHENSSKNDG